MTIAGIPPVIGTESNTMWPAITLIGILAVSFLNLTSFCYLQCRYLSRHDLFERAVAHQAQRIGDYVPGETPASYLAKHPNCCSIPDYQPSNSWLNLLLGTKIRYIRVVYPLPRAEIEQYSRAEKFYEAFVEITPCGRTYHAIGTSQTKPD